ncbi:MAG: hypothetical protein GY845_29565 [Planctomycetes bacterium]|nr:hypothetical protein [Planctomycetota bacterium]
MGKETGIKLPEGAAIYKLNNGKYAVVDEEMLTEICKHHWSTKTQKVKGQKKQTYAVAYVGAKMISMHAYINKTPKGYHTDHKNRNTLDNRKKNLRTATCSQNMQNTGRKKGSRIRNYTTYKGVVRRKRRVVTTWYASLAINNKKIYIGTYQTGKEAAEAYDKAAILYYGDEAYINFPEKRDEYINEKNATG